MTNVYWNILKLFHVTTPATAMMSSKNQFNYRFVLKSFGLFTFSIEYRFVHSGTVLDENIWGQYPPEHWGSTPPANWGSTPNTLRCHVSIAETGTLSGVVYVRVSLPSQPGGSGKRCRSEAEPPSRNTFWHILKATERSFEHLCTDFVMPHLTGVFDHFYHYFQCFFLTLYIIYLLQNSPMQCLYWLFVMNCIMRMLFFFSQLNIWLVIWSLGLPRCSDDCDSMHSFVCLL